MSFYDELNNLHNRLLTEFINSEDSKYLGAANCLVEAINYIAEAENMVIDKDYNSIIPNCIKGFKIDFSEIDKIYKNKGE